MFSAALGHMGPGEVIGRAVEGMETAWVQRLAGPLLCIPAAALPVYRVVLSAYSVLWHQPGALVHGDAWVAFMFVCMEQGRWRMALETCQARLE